MSYEEAIRNLNDAAYAAMRACRDTVKYPDVDQQTLRRIALDTDKMVDDSKAPALLAAE